MDRGSQNGPPLPPIGRIRDDHIKREESDAHGRHHLASSTIDMKPITTTPYAGPTPPHSHHTSASTNRSFPSPHSPDTVPRPADDGRDNQNTRLSLPSIHEYLNTSQPTSQPTSYQSHSYNRPPPPPHHLPTPQSPVPSGDTSRHPTYDRYPAPTHSQAHPASIPPPTSYPSAATYSSRPTTPPPPPAATSHGPTLHPISTSQTSRTYDVASQSWNSHKSNSYGQPSSATHPIPPPNYSQPHSSSTYPATSGPQYAVEPRRYSSAWRPDDREIGTAPGHTTGSSTGPNIGDSVKRHLEVFDLETSLNEMKESTDQLSQFTNYYAQQAHEIQRSGPIPGSTPPLSEVERMIRQGVRLQDSLGKLREVVVNHQVAMIERSKEQIPAQVNGHTNGLTQQDDGRGSGGFAGADPKKRRGRAAPPGNCHSCNRSETPEWRRGPDGARTLCNACGLHYAKLTRKLGGSKATPAGSSLRPKDSHTSL